MYVLGVLVGDFQHDVVCGELFFECHDKFDEVEGVGVEVFGEGGFEHYFGLIHGLVFRLQLPVPDPVSLPLLYLRVIRDCY